MPSDVNAGKPQTPFARMPTLNVTIMFASIWGIGAWLGYRLGSEPADAVLAPATAALTTAPPTAPGTMPSSSQSITSPPVSEAAIAELLEGEGTIEAADIPQLVDRPPEMGGSVQKHGILPEHLWMHATPEDAPTSYALCKYGICDLHQAQRTWNWAWQQLVGTADGRITQLPLSEAPPKATLCNVLFNPIHKIAFIKAPKTGSQPVLDAMGGLCAEGRSLKNVLAGEPCFVTNKAMLSFGLTKLGYDSWDALWADYTVFTVSRNPYSRAADAYRDITYHRHKQDGWCEAPSFELFCAKPYALGLQDLLFSCGDELNSLHMTEMQADCLVDADDQLAVDFIVRYENLEADYAALIKLVNGRKEASQPELSSKLNEGKDTAAEAASGPLAHPERMMFEKCGVRCMDLARIYYIDDFDVFQYAQTLDDPKDRRRSRRRMAL